MFSCPSTSIVKLGPSQTLSTIGNYLGFPINKLSAFYWRFYILFSCHKYISNNKYPFIHLLVHKYHPSSIYVKNWWCFILRRLTGDRANTTKMWVLIQRRIWIIQCLIFNQKTGKDEKRWLANSINLVYEKNINQWWLWWHAHWKSIHLKIFHGL